ncbi:MAG: DNA-binding protein [Spirochaetes bacterium]|nr:DNA-binding protein [Spirochaetota bacterium]
MKYSEATQGRIFILRLEHGDKLPDVIENFAMEKNILRGACFLIGGIDKKSRIVVGPKNGRQMPPEPMITELDEVHETFAFGTLFPDTNGIPKLHMHSASGRKKKSITGCVRPGVNIWQIGEVIIQEILDSKSRRKKNESLGFELLEIE